MQQEYEFLRIAYYEQGYAMSLAALELLEYSHATARVSFYHLLASNFPAGRRTDS
jgi:hypothetical protein